MVIICCKKGVKAKPRLTGKVDTGAGNCFYKAEISDPGETFSQ